MSDQHVCDICGKPATSLARDVKERDTSSIYIEYEATGAIKRGCDEHPAESQYLDPRGVVHDR